MEMMINNTHSLWMLLNVELNGGKFLSEFIYNKYLNNSKKDGAHFYLI